MDGFISNMKSKFAPKLEQEEDTDDKNRIDEVHATLAKVDPNTMDSTMVDVEDMTSLTEVSHKTTEDHKIQHDDIRPTNSKTNVSPTEKALSAATVAAFSIFKTPAEKDETEEVPDLPNPLEDDIFIYYD